MKRYIFILSGLILFCGEALLRQDFFGLIQWACNYPVNFFINWILIFSLLMVFSILFNRIGIGVLVVGGTYMTLCIISFYKFVISGEYLVPADLALAKEAASISKEMDIRIERQVVIGVLVSVALIISAFKCKWIQLQKGHRLVAGVLCTTLFFTTAIIGAKGSPNEHVRETSNLSLTVNEQYNENGFIVGFTKEIIDLIIEPPEGYSKEKVQNILGAYQVESTDANFIKPNIIMVMSESFFDVTKLEEVKFSSNPLANFKRYQEAFAKGNIVTAIYGGRTSQTEYEVLTGNSVYFTDPSNIAYNEFIHENTPSLAKLLKEEGYKTIALHGYEKAFFQRDKVYPNLGIDTFIASEELQQAKLARGYISDNALVDEIIKVFENKGQEPLFYHVVTMQNHMPYSDKYTANGIEVSHPNLSTSQLNALTTYVNGLKDSDKALEKLVSYFSKVEEPTIIVVYGDHLPALDEQYALYKDSHYIQGTFDERDCAKLYQTPFVVWNNYGLPKREFGTIDATYLSSQLMDYIGYYKDPYMNYQLMAKEKLAAYGEYFVIDKEGIVKPISKMNKEEQEIQDTLWMLQYDRLGLWE